ncbi:hypothetical protein HYV11_01170 [Candidatus Dependentiae bacterium]|nr:hypothetical protein [Candidatus Dependentiae bacterium]
MKYKIQLLVFCFTYQIAFHAIDNHSGQLFMFTRPTFNSIGIQQASWFDYGYHAQPFGSGLQIYPIYTQSYDVANNAEYFLFDFKQQLTMAGGIDASKYILTADGYIPQNPRENQISTDSYDRDILGQWFNYNDTTSGIFTVQPRQTQACCVFEFSQDIKKLTNVSFVDKFYALFRLPITYMCNNLGLKGSPEVVKALTKNNDFLYANFSNKNQKSTAVTNLQLLLGTKYLRDDETHIITGTGVIIPFVQQSDNQMLFQPVNGFNAHFGLTGLALFQFPLVVKTDTAQSKICFFFEFENNFLARNHQMRTYDLQGKPYSRYLKLLDRKTNSIVPATNALTIRSRVEPYNVFNMASGFRFKYKNSSGEVGYELWAHSTERVTPEPKEPWDDSRYGIAFINQDGELAKIDDSGNVVPIDTSIENGLTASNSTINFVGSPDGTVTVFPTLNFAQKNQYISVLDFNNFSAAARCTVLNRAYLTVGIGEKGKKRDFFANLGLYIEAPMNNCVLSMWGVWGKVGLAF